MENPKVYGISNEVKTDNMSPILEEFSEELMNMCGKCMDIGCGLGNVTKDFLLPLLGSNAQIIGTDISESKIKYANETYSEEKRLRFEVLDIETKILPKKYISEFDHVFSFDALHWCNDVRHVFKNIYQMLRSNGTILLYMISYHNMLEVVRILARDIRFAQYVPKRMRSISPYHESNNAQKELKELLRSVGFTVHHCSLRQSNFRKEELELSSFFNLVISIMPFVEDMPQDLKEEFQNALKYEYMKRTIKSIYNNQEFTLDIYEGLVVYAQKI